MEENTARVAVAAADQQLIVKVSRTDIAVAVTIILTYLGLRHVSQEENQVSANRDGVHSMHKVQNPVPLYPHLIEEKSSKATWVCLFIFNYDSSPSDNALAISI